MNEDPSLMKTLLEWSSAGVAALVGILWKVNSSTHEKHRENQRLLFQKLDDHEKQDEQLFRELTKEMNMGFKEITLIIHQNQTEVLRAMPKRKDDS